MSGQRMTGISLGRAPLNTYVPADHPPDEAVRQMSVDDLQLDERTLDDSLDRVTRLLGAFTGAPIAAFSVLDRQRQVFPSIVGLDARSTSRDVAFCGHTILQDDIFEVEDATRDPSHRRSSHPRIASAAGRCARSCR